MAIQHSKQQGFTLVEILIVVVILGILASIAIPQFSSATDQSKAVATASIVRTIQSKVLENYALSSAYPGTIDNGWFVEGSLPHNPLAPEQLTPVFTYESAGTAAMHPTSKLVSTSGAFWYNTDNGIVRALVPAQDTAALTLELYNTANSSQVANLSDTVE